MQKDDKTRNNALLFLPYINFRSRTNSETQARTPQKHHHSVVLIITFLIVMQQVKRVVVLFFSVLHFNTFHGFLTPHFPGQDRGKTDEGVFFLNPWGFPWGFRCEALDHLYPFICRCDLRCVIVCCCVKQYNLLSTVSGNSFGKTNQSVNMCLLYIW